MNILQTCLPHLSDVATVPWEIQKVIFNSIIHTYFVISEVLLPRFFGCYRRLYNVKLYHSRRGAGVTEWLDRYSDHAN